MIKNFSGHLIGLLIALLFFLLLAYIVKPSSETLKTENSFRVVDFIRLKKDTSLNLKISNDNAIRAFGDKLFIVNMKKS